MALPASDLTKKPDLRTTMELGAVLPETAEVRDDHLFIVKLRAQSEIYARFKGKVITDYGSGKFE